MCSSDLFRIVSERDDSVLVWFGSFDHSAGDHCCLAVSLAKEAFDVKIG